MRLNFWIPIVAATMMAAPAGAAPYNEDQMQLARWIGAAEASVIQCPSLKLSRAALGQALKGAGLKQSDYDRKTEFRRTVDQQKSSLLGIGQQRMEIGTKAADLSEGACKSGLSLYGPSGRFVPGLLLP